MRGPATPSRPTLVAGSTPGSAKGPDLRAWFAQHQHGQSDGDRDGGEGGRGGARARGKKRRGTGRGHATGTGQEGQRGSQDGRGARDPALSDGDGRSGAARRGRGRGGRGSDGGGWQEAARLLTLTVGQHSRQLRDMSRRDNLILAVPPDNTVVRASLHQARRQWVDSIPPQGAHPAGALPPILWATLCRLARAACAEAQPAARADVDFFGRLEAQAHLVAAFTALGGRAASRGPPDGTWLWSLCFNPHRHDGRELREAVEDELTLFQCINVQVRADTAPMPQVERQLRALVLGPGPGP